MDNFSLGKYKEYITGEQRGHSAKYADPLSLNFKLLIDFDSEVGLFADEKHINSALSFLKRIGETTRYEMLKNWIEIFKIFIKEYDFLLLEVEGLDMILNLKPGNTFIEEEAKINITIRETSDMLIQGLLSTYRHIVYDDIRSVEVLPTNLKRFNTNILVFSAGYYNMIFYDDGDKLTNKNQSLTTTSVEKLIYPTLRKLQDNEFNNKGAEKYNHLLFQMESCFINIEESGKSFLENVSNEMSGDYVKNNLALNFKFGTHKGRFNNIIGDIDFVGLLAIIAAQNKMMTAEKAQPQSFKDKLKGQLKSPLDNFKKSFTKNDPSDPSIFKTQFDSLKKSTLKTLESKATSQISKLTSKNSVVGNILSKMTPAFATQMIKNTVDVGINFVEKKAIDQPLTKLNNMLFQNFSNNLIDMYSNNFQKDINPNIGLIQNDAKVIDSSKNVAYTPEGKSNVKSGISYGVSNIYNRNGF